MKVPEDCQMKSIKKLILAGASTLLVLFGFYLAVHWGFERVYAGPDEALMVIDKFGPALPADRLVVPTGESYQGVRQELLHPPPHFLNPIPHHSHTVIL